MMQRVGSLSVQWVIVVILLLLAGCSSGGGGGQQRQLTVNKVGNGRVTSSPQGIDCGGACQANFADGQRVTLTAVADGGWTFTSWQGCDSTNGNRCTLTMNAAASVTATFSESTGNGQPAQISGQIGVPQDRRISISPGGLDPALDDAPVRSVASINQALMGLQRDTLASQSRHRPIRGRNAAMLSGLIGPQSQQGLFRFEGESVVAVNGDGDVLGAGQIEEDGSFELEFDVVEEETVALMQGYQDEDGNWVCTQPLEYQETDIVGGTPKTTGTRPALFRFGAASSAGIAPLAARAGLFRFNESSGNPAEDDSEAPAEAIDLDDAPEFADGRYQDCGNDEIVSAFVSGQFNWQSDFSPDVLYAYSLALGLQFDDVTEEADFVSTGIFDDAGTLDMEVRKVQGVDVLLSVAMTDVCFADPQKCALPLLPTYDLNAAAGLDDIVLDDDGFDYGSLLGDMVYLTGEVDGLLPGESAEIYAILNSEDILLFNYGFVFGIDPTYDLLAIATPDPSLSYYIFALDDAGCIYFPNAEPDDEDENGLPLYWLPWVEEGGATSYNVDLVLTQCFE